MKKINNYFFNYKFLSLIIVVISLVTYCPKSLKVSADTEGKSNKLIYLTFDDGPSIITEKVLDILKEQNIKATFFIIGNQIKGQEAMVKRMFNEGHSIGLHTYTHSFKKIYSSTDNFILEMIETQKEIYSLLGIKPDAIRFPGGSYKRLTKSFLKKLHSYGFKIYDWNLCTSDGLNYRTPKSKLYEQATRTIATEEPIILLLHCDYMHKNTYRILPDIINFYKDKGYEFKIIDEETPELYFPIKK